MKVILLQDVKKVGKKGQTVEVSDGYANNFLFPRKLAVKETKTSVEVLNNQKEQVRLEAEKLKAEAIENKEKLQGIVVVFKLKANNGKVFGSISTKQVEEQLKAEHGITIDRKKIITKDPINHLGYTRLKIELYKDVIGEIVVQVLEDK